MPEISRFFGIVIRMYFDDHNPPHFHATYEGAEAQFAFDPTRRIAGAISPRAEKLIIEWAQLHTAELHDNWRRLHMAEPASRIQPLD
jgi:hypothetical protein